MTPFAVEPVAASGMGLVCAAGYGTEAAFASMAGGETAAGSPPFHAENLYPVFLCARPANPSAKRSRTLELALCAAREALDSAQIDAEEIPKLRMGIALGTSVGASLDFSDFYFQTRAGASPPLDEIDRYLLSSPAVALRRAFSCKGPALTVTNACSSGADAIGIAASWIRSGLCDLALAGGADAISPVTYFGFASLRLLSPEACRPFDARRSGLSLGEGAAFLLLESSASRKRRGVAAQSFIVGYGTSTDAHHLTAPHPMGRGLKAAVEQAFAQAGLGWADMAFVNAHGTGTRTNDAAEAAFFAAHCPDVPLSATKGSTGHTLGAAGAVEAVLTACCLNRGKLLPSRRFQEADPEIGIAPVRAALEISERFALSQSLAFGGNNSVLLIGRGDFWPRR
ncbi:MAG: beta-ketoacyl-[acyl-carrier-protein] synthase family protein [Desulfovibrio sp.]|jgi:3-oxoacyl-[acyl-carrier-protein] synthase-1/3-oxoacyl-[acyl-carrier-protein] synthase II|nr:beta-ketoacyl-[acyl-carrier-protein] synthase family protein [Desulfovibrio sp.]